MNTSNCHQTESIYSFPQLGKNTQTHNDIIYLCFFLENTTLSNVIYATNKWQYIHKNYEITYTPKLPIPPHFLKLVHVIHDFLLLGSIKHTSVELKTSQHIDHPPINQSIKQSVELRTILPLTLSMHLKS